MSKEGGFGDRDYLGKMMNFLVKMLDSVLKCWVLQRVPIGRTTVKHGRILQTTCTCTPGRRQIHRSPGSMNRGLWLTLIDLSFRLDLDVAELPRDVGGQCSRILVVSPPHVSHAVHLSVAWGCLPVR